MTHSLNYIRQYHCIFDTKRSFHTDKYLVLNQVHYTPHEDLPGIFQHHQNNNLHPHNLGRLPQTHLRGYYKIDLQKNLNMMV